MKKKINIALLGRYFGWGGGIELLRIIANALALKGKSESLTIYLLLPYENKIDTADDFFELSKSLALNMLRLRFKSCKTRPLYDLSMLDFFENIDGHIAIVHYNDTERGLVRCLKDLDADVTLPVLGFFDNSFTIPWVGYIYDFQHKYYPQFFDINTCQHRDIFFSNILSTAKAVIVNSTAVKNDIHKFYPDTDCRIFSLPFAATPISSWFDVERDDIALKYRLPDMYFLISNQFWVHKSHETAFQALARMARKLDADVHIVCTGNTADHRFPGYFDELKAKLVEFAILDRVHFLGHIPKVDQIQIMKKSLAVIQPTMFEGGAGGGSVYDAVSLGVPAIVSDIPVNRELEEDSVCFFTAGSADNLADRMLEILSQPQQRPSRSVLVERGKMRANRLGDALLESINYVMR